MNLKIIEFLKNHLTLILLLTYSVSFVNFYLYYKSFNISIFNYLGLPDLLFYSIEYFFKIFLIIVVYEILIYIYYTIVFYFLYKNFSLIKKGKFIMYQFSNKTNKKRMNKLFDKQFDDGIEIFKFILIAILIFFVGFLSNKLIIFPAIFVYFFYLLESSVKEKMLQISIPFCIGILIFFMISSTLYNSYYKRFLKDDYNVSFKESIYNISTNKNISCLNYLGETSSHIFLYDIENKTSQIYSKSSIRELKIKNTSDIDSAIIFIKTLYPVKIFIESLNQK